MYLLGSGPASDPASLVLAWLNTPEIRPSRASPGLPRDVTEVQDRMVIVAHARHQRIPDLWEMEIEELAQWAGEAEKLLRALHAPRR